MNLLNPKNLLMTFVLVLLTILLAIIVVPFLIIVAICCLFSYIVMGISPLFLFNRNRERSDEENYGSPNPQGPGTGASGKLSDETIECEVISARTVNESPGEDR